MGTWQTLARPWTNDFTENRNFSNRKDSFKEFHFKGICLVISLLKILSKVLTLPQFFASPNLRADLPVCRLGDERRGGNALANPNPFPSSNAG